MADIRGYYEFHRACPAENLTIIGVSATGELTDSFIGEPASEGIPITGSYTDATNAISFNDAPEPGDFLFTSYYSGYVMADGQGGVCAMAGTYHELTITLQPRPMITTRQGSWYALWKGQIIG